MAAATNEWIRVAWRNESQMEQISLKNGAEKAMGKVEVTVSFDEGSVIIGEENYTEWKGAWKKLKNILIEGQKRNKQQSLAEKELQSKITKQYSEEHSGWSKCNIDPRKTSLIFVLQEQMVKTRAWKKIRGLVECDKCRLCGEHREIVHHLLSGCKKLVRTEYVKRHNNTLKLLAVKWATENDLLSKDTKWYTTNWERGKMIEKDEKKLFWDWEHSVRTNGIARRPDLTLEDTSKKRILLIDTACPNENNKTAKRDKKIGKYNRLCFELRERREVYTVKVVPTIIGCLGGGMKELKESIRQIFKYENNDKELEWISREMQNAVLWGSKSLIREVVPGLLT